MIKGASIIIHQKKAYIPVEAEIVGGPYIAVDPVFQADLTVESLISAFEQVMAIGHPQIETPPSRSEWRRRRDPVLAATGVRSWRQLDQEGLFYGVWWQNGDVVLYLHPLDADGQQPIVGQDRMRIFPGDVAIAQIAAAILEDVAMITRPDVCAASHAC